MKDFNKFVFESNHLCAYWYWLFWVIVLPIVANQRLTVKFISKLLSCYISWSLKSCTLIFLRIFNDFSHYVWAGEGGKLLSHQASSRWIQNLNFILYLIFFNFFFCLFAWYFPLRRRFYPRIVVPTIQLMWMLASILGKVVDTLFVTGKEAFIIQRKKYCLFFYIYASGYSSMDIVDRLLYFDRGYTSVVCSQQCVMFVLIVNVFFCAFLRFWVLDVS